MGDSNNVIKAGSQTSGLQSTFEQDKMQTSRDKLPPTEIAIHNEPVSDDRRDSTSASQAPDPEKQTAVPPKSEHEWVTGLQLWIVMTGITMVIFIMLLDVSIISTATPKITSAFHSLSNVGWYGAAYQLGNATLQPLTGKIYANFSTKWTFVVFILTFEFGSLLCAVSTSSNMLIVARCIAGIGCSGLQNGALTVIANTTPMHKRPALIGVVMGIGQLGTVGGPLIGGLLTQFVSWRWCFYINLPFGGFAATLIALVHIPERVPKLPPRVVLQSLHHNLDLVGFTIFAPTMIMLLLAIQWGGNQYSWSSPTVIGLLCGAGVTALIWLAWDYSQGENAMIPLPVLKKRVVWSSCVLSACLGSGLFMMSYYLPIYFQSVRGKSPAISGVFLLPSILSQLFASVFAGKLVGKFGYYMPWMIASSVFMSVGYGLLSLLTPTTSAGDWIGFQILAATGRGFGFQMPLVAVQNTVLPAQIPVSMSMLMFGQTLGGALSLSFADTIFTNSLRTLLVRDAPGTNVEAVVAAGAFNIRKVVSRAALSGVLKAYAGSIDRIFYLCAALQVCYFGLSFLTGWVDIREKRQPGAKKS